jgi:hypothetical protein
VTVKVSDDVAPTRIGEGANLLVITGGDTTATSSVALAVLPVPPLVEVTAEVLLVLVPAVVPVTVTEKVQVPPAAMLALASEIVVVVDVSVPPH